MLFSSDTLAQQMAINAGTGAIHPDAAGAARFFVAGGPQPDTPARRKELLTELLLAAGHPPEEASQGEIRYHESGQPYAAISSEADQEPKSYPLSVSHCRAFLAMALSTQAHQRIGLDAEQADRKPHPSLRRRVSCTESASDAAHPEQQITTLRLWTLKEAFLKMAGSGLRMPMREVEIRPENKAGSTPIYSYTAQSSAHHARLYSFQKDNIILAVALEIR